MRWDILQEPELYQNILACEEGDAFKLSYYSYTKINVFSFKENIEKNVGQLQLTLSESLDTKAAQSIMLWIQIHYEMMTARGSYYNTIKKNLTIKSLNKKGNIMKQTLFKDDYLFAVDFGTLDYLSPTPAPIELNLIYAL